MMWREGRYMRWQFGEATGGLPMLDCGCPGAATWGLVGKHVVHFYCRIVWLCCLCLECGVSPEHG